MRRLGIIMNGVTGRMGLNQHLERSILRIREEGGVRLSSGETVMPDPLASWNVQHSRGRLREQHSAKPDHRGAIKMKVLRSSALFFVSMGFLISACGLSAKAFGQVRLPHVFSDHAVLQRQKPIRIWGWGSPQEVITISFHMQKQSATADRYGLWQAWLKPEEAGGPYTLEVVGNKSAEPAIRKDILVGDVWIASGQSNMEFPLKGFSGQPLKNGDEEIRNSANPNLRLLVQHRRASAIPLLDSEDTWTQCTPDKAENFSAVAYFFGREVATKENVPVGLIDASWGGTPVQSWLSSEGIATSGVSYVSDDAAKVADQEAFAAELHDLYAQQDTDAAKRGQPPLTHERIPNDHTGSWTPTQLFNGMISPYVDYPIRGAIWYQGESDATPERAKNYARLFSTLIRDWRKQWSEGEFPFLFVQLSSYKNDDINWGIVRDAQRRTLELKSTGMAVTLDVGTSSTIHPPDKQSVGKRLATAAFGNAYGASVETSSPSFVQALVGEDSITVVLDHGKGLRSGTQNITDFEVAGEDHVFVPATARIEDANVVVSSPTLPHPRYVRYGWLANVNGWLYNAADLPLGTFTSE